MNNFQSTSHTNLIISQEFFFFVVVVVGGGGGGGGERHGTGGMNIRAAIFCIHDILSQPLLQNCI